MASKHSPERHKRHGSLAEEVTFRILCHASKLGSVLGKGGCIVKILRLATGAKIKVEDAVVGADHRIISITAPGSPRSTKRLKSEDEEEAKSPYSSAQEALFKVHERIVQGEIKDGDTVEASVTSRLLILSSQMSSHFMEQVRQKTGAQISKEQAPGFDDEILKIAGDFDTVKSAMSMISTGLYCSSSSSSSSFGRGAEAAEPLFPSATEFHSAFHPPADVPYSKRKVDTDDITFRVLCPYDRIGRIAGKLGSTNRVLCESNGSRIKIPDQITGSEDRIIIVSSAENSEDISPAQVTLLRVQERIDSGDFEGTTTARLLINSKQVGCLLGKGGSVIMDMRKSTGANIKILCKDELPLCASDTDELVQVVGEMEAVQEALVLITSRLRNPRRRPASLSPRSVKEAIRRELGSNSPFSPSSQGTAAEMKVVSFSMPSIEVMIPSDAVSSVLGKNGTHLAIIHQFSGAKVTLLDSSKPAVTERHVCISGTPQQMTKAQCLLEAFVISAGS